MQTLPSFSTSPTSSTSFVSGRARPWYLGERVHGGQQGKGAAVHDFSVNSHACGPSPAALAAVQQADATRYPDPHYTAVREQLALWHGVEPWRIVPMASASEGIARLTAWAFALGMRHVAVPPLCYGDYVHAARCWGMAVGQDAPPQSGHPPASPELETVPEWACAWAPAPVPESAPAPTLRWACHPSSPLGQAAQPPQRQHVHDVLVLDCAYAPLQLDGGCFSPTRPPAADSPERVCDTVWRLFTPNKALGLTGVRAAYAIAPACVDRAHLAHLEALAPSWAIGAHGLAMLQVWPTAAVQDWLQASLDTLRGWKAQQIALLHDMGWQCAPSVAHFFCARPAAGVPASLLAQCQQHGVQLRDCTSFGLAGWWRLGVLAPSSQHALRRALGGADGAQ